MTKTALITGGSRGIGAATADMLREREWRVLAPGKAALEFGSLRDIIDRYKTYLITNPVVYQVDAVVFCHGEWYSKTPLAQDQVDWHVLYDSRVVQPWKLMNELLRTRPPECVVMVSSTRGFIGGVVTGPYSAACAAQIALMQGYALEYPGTRFNVVCPGLADTDMGREVVATGGAKPGAVGQPAEAVASEIVRLIESGDNGRVMRVVDGAVTEAKWTW